MPNKNFSGEHFDAQHFGNSSFPGGGSVAPPTGCVGLYYAERADVELAFGSTNVAKWADVNNNNSTTEISDRVCWGLKNSHAYINDRMNGGPYAIPFVAPFPSQIVMCCAKLAAVYLYDSRGVTDFQQNGQEENQMSFFRKECEMFLRGLLSNRYNLVGVTRANNTPFVSETPKEDKFTSRFLGSGSCPNS